MSDAIEIKLLCIGAFLLFIVFLVSFGLTFIPFFQYTSESAKNLP